MVAHACNPSTQEAEAEVGSFLSSRPAWCTQRFPEQPELYRETLSQQNKTNKQTNKKAAVFSPTGSSQRLSVYSRINPISAKTQFLIQDQEPQEKLSNSPGVDTETWSLVSVARLIPQVKFKTLRMSLLHS